MPLNHTQRGRDALARADWQEAKRRFQTALDEGESPEALEGLAMAEWWLGDLPAAFLARERAFQVFRRQGDRRGAARVAMALAQDHAYCRGAPAVAVGWYRRARRLLAGLPCAPEHGWLEVGLGDLALAIERDPLTARRRAARAATIGRRLALLDLEMMGLALEGLALVCAGATAAGMPRLDEATTAAVSGEMEDFFAIGYAYCCLVQACVRVRDFERAAQWCDRAHEFGRRVGFELLSSICRTQHASVLIWRGCWSEADVELAAAVRHLHAIWPPLEDEGTVRIAQLRRLQGRRREAEALLAVCDGHPLAVLERAALAADAGDATTATELSDRYLRQTHPADLTERIPGLEVLLAARLAIGDHAGAATVLAELQLAAQTVGTTPVRAAARLGEGALLAAGGAHETARAALEDAVDLYRRSGAAYETGRARLALAHALLALGRREAAVAEATAAHEAFAALGATRDLGRAEELLTELASGTVRRPEPAAPRLTRRELEVLGLLAEGLSNAQIAVRLGLSVLTVKRHVANILGKLDLPTRAAAAAFAVRNRLA
jgi:LuxR family transcriptional regulator, maltose regulon positive regulatory protein